MEKILANQQQNALAMLHDADNLEQYHQACMAYTYESGFSRYTLVKLDLRHKHNPPATVFTNKHFKVSTLFTTYSYNRYRTALTLCQHQTTPFVEIHKNTNRHQFITAMQFYEQCGNSHTIDLEGTRVYFPFHMRYQHNGFLMLSGSSIQSPGGDRFIHGKLFADYLAEKITRLQNSKRRQQQVKLNQKESQCLYLLADGCSYEEIGKALGIAADTVNYHIKKITNKFGAKSRFQAIALAISDNQTPPQL